MGSGLRRCDPARGVFWSYPPWRFSGRVVSNCRIVTNTAESFRRGRPR